MQFQSTYEYIEDQLPFPLFNQHFLDHYSKDQQQIGHLNQEMLHLNHKCKYKWLQQPKIQTKWSFENEIKIFVTSWNMHGMIPGYSLKRLFRIDELHHDLIVVGTQECSRSIAFSLLCESKDSWEIKLSEELGNDYRKVISASLNAMHIIAFAHVSLIPRVTGGKIHSLSQGFMNVVGNKGGVAISMMINEKLFLFANSHLESGQGASTQRHQQLNKLETHFENQVINKHSNLQYDYLIWTGDFNSRIEDKITSETIRSHSDFFSWLSKDQMYLNRNNQQDIFQQFQEGMIFFPPTYKLLENINQWAVGKDFRIPGWCDRILFKENQKTKIFRSESKVNQNYNRASIKLQNYDANFDILGSDHRPVFAQFTVNFGQ